jgi:hypothetical protein
VRGFFTFSLGIFPPFFFFLLKLYTFSTTGYGYGERRRFAFPQVGNLLGCLRVQIQRSGYSGRYATLSVNSSFKLENIITQTRIPSSFGIRHSTRALQQEWPG